MKGYKAFNKDLQCRDYQFVVGSVFTKEGKLEICSNGFHFCEKLKDIFEYYPKTMDTRVCEVEALGEVITEGDKSVTSSIRITRELSREEISRLTDNFKFNSGNCNSGDRNSGNYNSGTPSRADS